MHAQKLLTAGTYNAAAHATYLLAVLPYVCFPSSSPAEMQLVDLKMATDDIQVYQWHLRGTYESQKV